MLYHNGDYHYDSYGSFPVGNARLGEFVYITKVSRFGTFPYHISIGNTLGSGDLGWVSKTQLKKLSKGNERKGAIGKLMDMLLTR